MACLSLFLLGPLRVTLDDRPLIDFESDRARALLAYLAVEADHPHQRETLSGLLWPDYPDAAARNSLRQALFKLRSTLGERDQTTSFLAITRSTVGLNPAANHQVDATTFDKLLAACQAHPHRRLDSCPACRDRLAQATALYRGDFLEGVFLANSILFEEWVLVRREQFRRRALDSLGALARYHDRRGEHEPAAQFARRQLELEPWREEAHRQLMRALALMGQRSAALAQYEACRLALSQELDAEPDSSTTYLYQQIRLGAALRDRESTAHQPGANLPAALTPFVGRARELAHIQDCLENPACRLLTLAGLAGIGKTRLALEAGERAARSAAFAHGVHFVALAPPDRLDDTWPAAPAGHSPALQQAERLISALAAGLQVPLQGGQGLKEQVVRYLQPKELLLIIDNGEHALRGMGLLLDMLKAGPRVKILVTSRERLRLAGEWVLDIEGLGVPGGFDAAGRPAAQPADASALELFLQTGQRMLPGFSPSAADRAWAIRICQLVAGAPLAIELAASWLRGLSCAEIAHELERGLDFLDAFRPQGSSYQHSLRAVLDESWGLLAEAERAVLCGLSIFRGSFRKDAAEQVTGATSLLLLALVDKAILRYTPEGRYEVHELIRQYAAERLQDEPGARARIAAAHSAYFARFLDLRCAPLRGGRQAETLQEIEADIENIRAAWNWMIAEDKHADIERSLDALFHFFYMRSWFQEGERTLKHASETLARGLGTVADLEIERSVLLGRVLAREAWFSFHLGHHEQARQRLERALATLQAAGARHETAFCLSYLGAMAYHRQEYAQARTYLQQSLAICRECGDSYGASVALTTLGVTAYQEGDYATARLRCEESLALKRETGDRWGAMYSYICLGNVAIEDSDYAQARSLLGQGLTICQAIGDRRGMATSLTRLGFVAEITGEPERARQTYEEGLALAREIGDALNTALLLIRLGNLACGIEDYRGAARRFHEALQALNTIQPIPRRPEVTIGLAILLLHEGHESRARELLAALPPQPGALKAGWARHMWEERLAQMAAGAAQPPAVPFEALVGQIIAELENAHE